MSRFLLYLVYFFGGIGAGAWGLEPGLESGLLASGGKLARGWPLWLIVAVLVIVARSKVMAAMQGRPWRRTWPAAFQSGPAMAAHILFPVFCAAASFACLALFIRAAIRGYSSSIA